MIFRGDGRVDGAAVDLDDPVGRGEAGKAREIERDVADPAGPLEGVGGAGGSREGGALGKGAGAVAAAKRMVEGDERRLVGAPGRVDGCDSDIFLALGITRLDRKRPAGDQNSAGPRPSARSLRPVRRRPGS